METADIIPKFTTLPSGLTLMFVDESRALNGGNSRDKQLFTISLTVRFGYESLDNLDERMSAHFIEHLVAHPMILGELGKKLNSNDVPYSSNASTSTNETNYYISGLMSDMDYLLDGFVAMFNQANISKMSNTIIENERSAVEAEIQRSSSSVSRKAFKYLYTVLYKEDKHVVYNDIHHIAGVKTINKQRLHDIKEQFYYPANMVMAVGGSFDDVAKKQIIGKAKQLMADTVKPLNCDKGCRAQTHVEIQKSLRNTIVRPNVKNKLIHHHVNIDSATTTISFLFPSVHANHSDRAAYDVVAQIFGGVNGILMERLRNEKGYVYSASAANATGKYEGVLTLTADATNSKLADTISEVIDIIKNAPSLIDRDAYKQAAKTIRYDIVSECNTIDSYTKAYLDNYVHEDMVITPSMMIDMYTSNAEMAQKVNRIIREVLTPNNMIIFTSGNVSNKTIDSAIININKKHKTNLDRYIPDVVDATNINNMLQVIAAYMSRQASNPSEPAYSRAIVEYAKKEYLRRKK